MHINRKTVRIQLEDIVYIGETDDDANQRTVYLVPNQTIREEASQLLANAQYQADHAAMTDSLYFNCGSLVYASESGVRAKKNAHDARERADNLERLSQAQVGDKLAVTVEQWVLLLRYFCRPVSIGAESEEVASGPDSRAERGMAQMVPVIDNAGEVEP